MLKTQTKKITAFMSVVAMLLSMLLYFPNGTFSLDFGLKASAATITPSQPGGDGTSDSPYKIGTAAELYWFAACVNGTDGVTQDKSAWAVLTADITVNSNLLGSLTFDSDGNVSNGGSFTSWTPIGWYDYDNQVDYSYTGTFDGQGHTISGLYLNDSTVKHVGLFGFNKEGTVKNVGVIDSYFTSNGTVGGVCGYNVAKITNCYNAGKVIATDTDTDVGGVCGNNKSTITNCYNTGTVSGCGLGYVGGVCGNNRGTIRNCYYDSDKYSGNAVGYNYGTVTDVEGKATAQFNRGEVAYLLSQGCTVAETTYFDGSVWGQTMGTDNYPVLGGKKVYATTGCVTYNNDGNTAAKEHNYTFTADKHSCIDCGLTESHNFGDDGVCTACNTYTISDADQLYTFADMVKNENLKYKNANAVLAADITVNTGVLKSDGSLADDTNGFRSWTPIGYSDFYIYTGTFDGQGHTVSGLYFNDSGANFVGLFGCVGTSGSVSNVGVVDSYFNGNNNVGGVSGYCNGKIINCYNKSTVSGSNYVGGVCGEVGPDSKSVIVNCYNTGIIKGKSSTACIVGYYGSSESGKVSNCYYYGEKAEDDDNPPLVTQPINPINPILTSNTAVSFVPSITTTNRLIPGIIKTTATTTTTTTTTTTENTTSVTVSETSSSTQSSSDTSAATKDEHATCKTPEQFKSGEVAYLLSQGCTIGETTYDGSVWGQTIGKEKYPVLGGAKVYTANNCIDYSNTENDTRAHNYVNGICQWCGDIENNVMIYGQSVTLDGTIGMNVYVIADDDYTDWTARFNDKVVEKPEKDENGLYKFTYQVAAKDMEKEIIFYINDAVNTKVSVKGYLEALDTNGSTELAELATAMETYGDAASEYFKTDGAVPEVAGVADNACDSYVFTKKAAPEGISYYGSSLILESETTVRHYFTLAEGRNIENFKFYVDDVEVTPKEKQNYYYIDIENISAENLDTPHTVKIDDIEVISNYSALSYASAVLNSDTADDNLKNLVKTLYLYNQKANAYGSN